MAYIYPKPGETHSDVTRQLEALEGVRGIDFAMEFGWDGTHMFAVTPELHEKWLAKTRKDNKAEAAPASDADKKQAGPDGKSAEPPASQSTTERAPAATSDSKATPADTDAKTSESQDNADDAAGASSNPPSGTTTKRSATKNGPRRS